MKIKGDNTKPCRYCNGTGKRKIIRECEGCNGTGRVYNGITQVPEC